MNRFGVVIHQGCIVDKDVRGVVMKEVIAAGWHRVPSNNPDEGMIYVPATAPDDGKGSE